METILAAFEVFGKPTVLRGLKRHYCNVTCQGDVIVNERIALMHDACFSLPTDVYTEHITDTLTEWLERGSVRPDAWWGS